MDEVGDRPARVSPVVVRCRGATSAEQAPPATHPCDFDPRDILVGGSAQRTRLAEIISGAQTRAIIHSTFPDHAKFVALLDVIKPACVRGVTFDLL